MDVTPLIRADAKIIQSYRDGAFKVSNTLYSHSIIVLPDRVLSWTPSDPVQVTDFAEIAAYRDQIEIFLLGTGDKQKMLPPAIRQGIKAAYGFTVDAMDNGAAARTYNALMAEGRLVAVGLIRE